MKFRKKPHETLQIRSMGKSLNITAIFDNDDEANEFMQKNTDHAVIACYGPLVFLANKFDKGAA